MFGRSEVVVRSKRVPLQAALRHPFPMRDQPYNECGMEQSLFRAWEGELRRKKRQKGRGKEREKEKGRKRKREEEEEKEEKRLTRNTWRGGRR